MQYIQFQPQLSGDVDTPDTGNLNLFADTITGTLLLKDSNGNTTTGLFGISNAPAGQSSWDLATGSAILDIGKRYQIIDITSNAGSTDNVYWYLPTGSYDGQQVTLILVNGNGTSPTMTPSNIQIVVDLPRYAGGYVSGNDVWYPFERESNSSNWRGMATAVYFSGAWTVDNMQWD